MKTKRLTTKVSMVAGAAAVVAMGALTAGCGSSAKDEPSTTPPATSSKPQMIAPSEKAVGPGGDNSFSPTINPKPPGAVCKDVVNGICIR